MSHLYNETYSGWNLERIGFPLGGIGAGMFCLEGAGGISNVSLRHNPEVFHDPLAFSAIAFADPRWPARVLAGPVPDWKVQFPWVNSSGDGARGKDFGLPRFRHAEFMAKFPFAFVSLHDEALPVRVEICGWSPFTPGNTDDSSLPVAALEYTFWNTTDENIDLTYSFNASNFMDTGKTSSRVRRQRDGFILEQDAGDSSPDSAGAFLAEIDEGPAFVNPSWFRGGWFDSLTVLWKDICSGECVERTEHPDSSPSPGGTLAFPISLAPYERKTVKLRLSWYVPFSDIRIGDDTQSDCDCDGCCDDRESPVYQPWYAGRFTDVHQVAEYWRTEYVRLRNDSSNFSKCFFDSTMPAELIEAVSSNLSILKSPTVLRQIDGRLWAYEGCNDTSGCCSGSCTHVWNYAQAIPHLFPDLERTLRETEFNVSQDETGHQVFRTPLPIAATSSHGNHAAADGQLGGLIKLYRDWRICGDLEWLRSLWPAAKKSVEYCIEVWDPDLTGTLIEPHHNTYDIEFWGPDGMCTSIYLVALEAAVRMCEALEEDASLYRKILGRGRIAIESDLYDGEYFIQDVRWKDLRAGDPTSAGSLVGNQYDSNEAVELLRLEGPKYQYGTGCLSDGVLGVWLGEVSGICGVVDETKIKSHLEAVYRYNFRRELSGHANPQRPTYALGNEGGLLLCSWPKGGEPRLPFVYSNEVWTGIEYQVASHLIISGCMFEALEIVRACRDRYDGTVRNPFDEYECGHWYARALASYSLIQAFSGARYDAVTRTLHVHPSRPGNLRAFISTATGYGTVIVENNKARLEVVNGEIDVDKVDFVPFSS